MTKSNCTFNEQKKLIVEFLKTYKNLLCIHDQHTNLSEQHINHVANAKNYDLFFEAVCDIRLKVGNSNYFLFSNNPDERHKALSLSMPVCIDNMHSDTSIDKFIGHKTIVDLLDSEYCEFVNITPRRWKNFVKMFNNIVNYIRVENKIAYLDVDYIVKQYAAVLSKKCGNDKNQIDNVIASYNECSNIFQKVVDELLAAKLQGAIKVVADV